MATYQQQRDAIQSMLSGINGIGIVHNYERYAKREADFQAFYKDTTNNRILGWNFSRVSTAELDLDNGGVRRVYTWRIRGFMSIDDADASERTFQELIETICSTFRTNPTLGLQDTETKNLAQEDGPAGIQVDAVEPVMFAGVLCHRATLTLVTESTEAKS